MVAEPFSIATDDELADDAEVEAALERRGAILEAVRLAAESFLDPDTAWTEHLPGVLARLAEATGTSRVYLFENYRWDDDGEVWATQTFEWSAPGVRSIADVPELAALPFRASGFARWIDHLRRGEPIVGLRRDMLPEEQVQLTADETLSIAVVPVLVEGEWWGMLGFDECAFERAWTAGEIDGLRAAATAIGAAIVADRAEEALRAREGEYRAVFEAAGDGLVVADAAGRLVAANPAFCAIYGTTLDEVLGQDLAAWLDPDVGPPVEVRTSTITFDGQDHVLGVVRDISERAAARASLERRVQALSTVAASLTIDQPLPATLDGVARAVVDASDAVACEVQLPDVPASDPSVVVVPMNTVGDSGGALHVHYPDGRRPTDDAAAFFQALADQAAVAVENDRLLHSAQGSAALEERQRLARELHDSVSQALYGIALGARTARTVAGQQDRDALVGALEYVLDLAEAALAEMRALIFELRPETLASEGIVAALDRQLRALRARHGIEVDADLGTEPDAPLPVKEAIYRIAQESLHNIVKHADARRVTVHLRAPAGRLELTIEDDGRGFDPDGSFPGHLGLHSMRERAEALTGSLVIESRPGQGSRVEVALPTEVAAHAY